MNKLIVFLLGFAVACMPAWARAHHNSRAHSVRSRFSRSHSSRTAVSRHRSRRGKHVKTAHRSHGQQAPTAERYRQIQQALADKGYFKGQVNGEWGPDSVDALKRFQADQNLDVDGKIGSLSLIALGLGPKRNLSAQATPSKQPSTDPPPAVIPQ